MSVSDLPAESAPQGVERAQHYIEGEFVSSADDATFNVVNPATGKSLAAVSEGSATDVDRAVTSAKAALKGPWGEMELPERTAVLRRLGGAITAHAADLAYLEALDVGMPWHPESLLDQPDPVFSWLVEEARCLPTPNSEENKSRVDPTGASARSARPGAVLRS